MNILVVDDDTIYQYVTSKTLEATGCTNKINLCSNGREAYQFLEKNMGNKSEMPDIILLDVNMPVMNGWEFLQECNNLGAQFMKGVRIFLVTSSVDDADLRRSQQFDAVHDYIVKPLMKEKLSQILEAASLQII